VRDAVEAGGTSRRQAHSSLLPREGATYELNREPCVSNVVASVEPMTGIGSSSIDKWAVFIDKQDV